MTTDLSVRILSQSLQNLCDSLNDLLFLNWFIKKIVNVKLSIGWY